MSALAAKFGVADASPASPPPSGGNTGSTLSRLLTRGIIGGSPPPVTYDRTGAYASIPRVTAEAAQGNPDAVIGAITRGEWEFEKQFFRPLEDQLREKAAQPVDTFVGTARQDVATQFDNQQSRRQRDFARRGVSLSERARRVMARNDSLAETSADSGAANDARRRAYDRRLDILSTLAANARGVGQAGRGALGDAAGMWQAREENYKNNKAQAEQSNRASAASLAAAAIIAF